MKVRVRCPVCKSEDPSCGNCSGYGNVTAEIHPKEIKEFLSRPEKTEFECVGCPKKETILRPLPSQIPSGWIIWNSEALCQECKSRIVLAAIVAVDGKISRLKENKNGKLRSDMDTARRK